MPTGQRTLATWLPPLEKVLSAFDSQMQRPRADRNGFGHRPARSHNPRGRPPTGPGCVPVPLLAPNLVQELWVQIIACSSERRVQRGSLSATRSACSRGGYGMCGAAVIFFAAAVIARLDA